MNIAILISQMGKGTWRNICRRHYESSLNMAHVIFSYIPLGRTQLTHPNLTTGRWSLALGQEKGWYFNEPLQPLPHFSVSRQMCLVEWHLYSLFTFWRFVRGIQFVLLQFPGHVTSQFKKIKERERHCIHLKT